MWACKNARGNVIEGKREAEGREHGREKKGEIDKRLNIQAHKEQGRERREKVYLRT